MQMHLRAREWSVFTFRHKLYSFVCLRTECTKVEITRLAPVPAELLELTDAMTETLRSIFDFVAVPVDVVLWRMLLHFVLV